MCSICGQPGYIRCNCASAQPFCDQCDSNGVCVEKMDSQCVIYHFATTGYTPPPTRLINLGLPNGSSAETIFEKIDTFFGAGFFRPWTTGNTSTLDLELDGPGLPVVLKGNVNVSAASGNTLVINSDGLYVPGFSESGKVKVSAIDPLKYLEDAVVGGTDGCVSLTIARDPSSGLLFFHPTISAACLFTNLFNVEDTNSIHLDLNTSDIPVILKADSKVSAASGNTLVINSDGLYSAGGSVNAADNGLSLNGSIVELGGPLIHNTTIGFNNGAYYLQFNSTPQITLGESVPSGTGLLEINNTYTNGFNLTAGANFTTTTALRADGGGIGSYNNVIITGGTDTDEGVKAGAYGQIFFRGSATLNSGDPESGYAGVHGIIVPSGVGTVITTGSAVPAGVIGGAFASDDATVTNLAAIFARGMYQSPGGASYTGTITNYYGLYIESLAGSGLGSHMTNKFGIYQVGTTDVNRFFGPVQNAGGTTQFTSDARVKENISNFTRGLKEIEQIETHLFNYTYNKDKVVTGIIAQELEAIIPEAVEQGNFAIPDGDEFTDFRMVDQNVLFYTMLNAIKELSSQNKALNDRIFALEARNTTFSK